MIENMGIDRDQRASDQTRGDAEGASDQTRGNAGGANI